MNNYKRLELENKNFHSTIQKIREYANLNDDWYINGKLDLLEQQTPTDIKKLRLEKKIIRLQKKIDKLNNYKK